MSKRKTWLLIKRGLSEDPKHREAMGKRIWLFMHIIDRADWETGIVSDWRDKDEAQDMGLNWRTLQQQRQELDALGYISCAPDGNGQKIVVYNWVNPKNYAGEVVNPKREGYVNLSTGGTVTSTSDLRTPSIGHQISNDAANAAEKPPTKVETPQVTTTKEIQCIYESLLGYPLNGEWASGESKAAKTIGAHYTAEQITEAYKYYKSTPFWSDKRLTLRWLSQQMGEFVSGNIHPRNERKLEYANHRPTQQAIQDDDPEGLARARRLSGG